MFIIKFNNMVKNKWVWAAFAVIVAVAFGFSDILGAASRSRGDRSTRGSLAGKPVDPARFDTLIRLARFERGSSGEAPEPREIWKSYAALERADQMGIRVSDRALAQALRNDPTFRDESGVFDQRRYEAVLRQAGLTPVAYQEMVRARIRLLQLREAVSLGPWAAPSVVEDRLHGVGDVYTLVGATFSNAFAAAETEISAEEAKAFHDAHADLYRLPERRSVAYVTFSSLKWRDSVVPSDDDVYDWYDAHQRDYVSKDTNGVETVRELDEVRPEIEKALKVSLSRDEAYKAAVEFADWFFDNKDAQESDFAARAAEAGLTVTTSRLFAAGAAPLSPALAEPFSEAVFALGGDSLAERVTDAIGGETAESIVGMLLEVDPEHVEPYDEIADRVLADARSQKAAASFQQAVTDLQTALSEQHALGTNFVDAARALGLEPGTNVVFSYLGADAPDAPVPSPRRVAQAMTQCGAGDLCPEPIPVEGGVFFFEVVSREPGDGSLFGVMRDRMARSLASETADSVWDEWLEANLDAMDPRPAVPFDAGEGDEEPVEDEEEAED